VSAAEDVTNDEVKWLKEYLTLDKMVVEQGHAKQDEYVTSKGLKLKQNLTSSTPLDVAYSEITKATKRLANEHDYTMEQAADVMLDMLLEYQLKRQQTIKTQDLKNISKNLLEGKPLIKK
jgi:enolase